MIQYPDMQTATVRKSAKNAFFRQIVKPDSKNINIPVPRKWFGKELEVVVSPVQHPPLRMEDLNAETLAAIEEVQEMKRNPHLYKSYTNVEEMIREILADDDV